jgi:NAD-dependent DNA ligase
LDGLTIGKYVKANSDKITSFLKHFDFTKVKTGALEGIPVSITGGWNPMTRDMLTDHLRKSGFILSDRVTKTCKILLTGEKPSPAKIEKARGWNIPVVNIISLNDVNSIISLISK